MISFHFLVDPKGFKVENLRKLDEQEKLEYGDSDEEDGRIHLPLKKNKPKRVRNYKNKMENWENAEVQFNNLQAMLNVAIQQCFSTNFQILFCSPCINGLHEISHAVWIIWIWILVLKGYLKKTSMAALPFSCKLRMANWIQSRGFNKHRQPKCVSYIAQRSWLLFPPKKKQLV